MGQDPYKYFRVEAHDLLDQFSKNVLDLEKSEESTPYVQQLLRLAHTLKGAARVVKQQEIANRAHAIEDALSPFRETGARVEKPQINEVLRQIDEIGARLKTLSPETSVAAPATGVAAPERGPAVPVPVPLPEEAMRTVRADIAEMDGLLDSVSETHALLNRLRTAVQDADRTQHLSDILMSQLAPRSGTEIRRAHMAGSDRLFSMAEELRRRLGTLERNLASTVDQMDRELRQVRDAAEQLRMVSASTLFMSLERMTRDTAQALSKKAAFQGTGGDIRLDSHVIETVRGALLQIIRNAVAHGIEPENERRKLGKAEIGRVSVAIIRRGAHIVFECRDDGRGIDVEAIKRVARERGLLDAKAEAPGIDGLTRLLLRGGISTSSVVTEVSGRGVGLDIVREAMSRLGGEISIDTKPGQGTTFRLTVPRSLASVEALLVEASGSATIIPLEAVRASMRVRPQEVSRAANGDSVLFGASAVPFVPLSKMLNGTRVTSDRAWTAVVVQGAEGVAAIGVDRLMGTGRFVVHPLPENTPASPLISGASLDPEGNPQLVLDPDGLVAEAVRTGSPEVEATGSARPVLVIDDSLTTRMLEQSILESAGYDVDLALSGEEALERARRKRYALFLVDVEMPGMNGFTFIERIRSDPSLHDIPAILVTSLDSQAHRQRGQDAGAQGYVVKSEFDQAELLKMIKTLMG